MSRNKTLIVVDKGLYLYLAQRLGEYFDKVYYYFPSPEPYPESPHAEIGKGLPEVERINKGEFWRYLPKADAIIFFDCYDGDFQQYLIDQGHNVFGSGLSEKIELEKIYFMELLDKLDLSYPPTYLAEGVDDLLQYLEGKKDKHLKTPYYRGDFETYHYRNMRSFRPWLNDVLHRIGEVRRDRIEILIQDPIESVCELGYDGFCINGTYTDYSMSGYEIKDKGYVGRIFPDTPPILDFINQKFAPIHKKLGCRSHFSTEIRVTKAGEPYFIDPTERAPSPPAEVMCKIYKNYPEAIFQISCGEVPDLDPVHEFCAEIVLTSPWHNDHELCVEFPPDLTPYIKLKNHTKRGKYYYCIPNKNGSFFGAVVATGSTLKQATSKCLDVLEQIEADELEYDKGIFDKAQEQIDAGKEWIPWD